MGNHISILKFLLLQYSSVRELQMIHFFVFIILYMAAVTGNLIIITIIVLDHHLHTPMYFFLMNLAMVDLDSVSVMVPKSMAMSLMNDRSISYPGCVAQVFFYFFFAASDLAILTIMAHDHYVAICNLLHYERVMHKGACIKMVAIGEIVSLLYAVLHTGGTFAFTFCPHIVPQFFCEVPQLIKLSCSGINLVEVGFLVLGCIIGAGCYTFIIRTYIQIFAAVLRIPSEHVWKKSLSTCLPHLTVVSMLIFSAIFAYAKPPTDASSELDMAFAVIYVVIPSIMNPFIYSMRNKEIKAALWKKLRFGTFFKNNL